MATSSSRISGTVKYLLSSMSSASLYMFIRLKSCICTASYVRIQTNNVISYHLFCGIYSKCVPDSFWGLIATCDTLTILMRMASTDYPICIIGSKTQHDIESSRPRFSYNKTMYALMKRKVKIQWLMNGNFCIIVIFYMFAYFKLFFSWLQIWNPRRISICVRKAMNWFWCFEQSMWLTSLKRSGLAILGVLSAS